MENGTDNKKPPMDRERHIDTTGLPKKFDVADLIESGVTGDELIAWCKARVRPGPPVLTQAEHHSRNPKRKVDIEKKKQPPKIQRSNVVAIPDPEPAPEPEQLLDIPPEFSEDMLAEQFTKKYHKTMSHCATWNTWLHWAENRWQVDDTNLSLDHARTICRAAASVVLDRGDIPPAKGKTIANQISSRRCYGAVEGIASTDRRHVVRPSHFDADPWILNTPDGVINLKTGKMRKARRSDWCIKSTRVGPSTKGCPRWLTFLNECTQGDTGLQEYLQRIAGYCLTGSTAEQKFFFIYGQSGSGKGTFLNTLMWLMDTYATQANMDTFTEQRFVKHAAEIAFFNGARLIVAAETNSGQRWNEARIKTMTGGDPITANRMRQDPFTFLPAFKLLFMGNHRPHLRNVDAAIKRRLFFLPFDLKVPKEKIDFYLADRLREEGAGILSWAIDGCLDWQKKWLQPPDSVIASTANYFEQEDKIGAFLEDCCTVSSHSRVITTTLYECYVKWADTMGLYAGDRLGFLDLLSVKGFVSEKKGGEQIVMGVEIFHDEGSRQKHEF